MKTLSQATWTRYGDQPVVFPVFRVKRKQQGDIFTLKLESVGQWLIVPVVQEEEGHFSHREIIGWACIVQEGDRSMDPWMRRYECPTVFASKKKARAYAERYRLYPLNTMTPLLEDPQDYVLQQ